MKNKKSVEMTKGSFKKEAAKHQLFFFNEKNQSSIINKKGRAQNHWLNDEGANNGEIFYNDYDIFYFVKERRKKTNTPEWFYDTLRSQHIPYNFFVPLTKENTLAIDTFKALFNLNITKINSIEIEYPSQYKNPLSDKTSFDVFVSYSNNNDENGLLGIEVKYTEGGYSTTKTEKTLINNNSSIYYITTEQSKLYKEDNIGKLKENSYRQIWRNHLLAYAFAEKYNYKEFTSVTLYHKGNTHFQEAFTKYDEFLTEKGKETLRTITFSQFCEKLADNATENKQKIWILYLIERYNIQINVGLLNQLKQRMK